MAIDHRCKPLHIPYKHDKLDHQNVDLATWMKRMDANWLAVERWASDLVNYCLCDCGGTSLVTIASICCGVNNWTAAVPSSFTWSFISTETNATGGDVTVNLSKNGSPADSLTIPSGAGAGTFTGSLTITVAATDFVSFSYDPACVRGSAHLTLNVAGQDDTINAPDCG